MIDRIKKKDSICNICQKTKPLSKDHVPPKSCQLTLTRETSTLFDQLTGNNLFRPRFEQNGVWYKTICSDCNNFLGSEYDPALATISKRVKTFLNTKYIRLPPFFDLDCEANAVMRSVLGHLLAANTNTDPSTFNQLVRPCVINPSIPIPNDIHVFYWVYPYDRIVVERDFFKSAVRGKFEPPACFNLIKFYPLAFLVTHKLSSYDDLLSLHQFNHLLPPNKTKVRIDFRRPFRDVAFPEFLDNSAIDFVAFGAAGMGSVVSAPKPKKTLRKSQKS